MSAPDLTRAPGLEWRPSGQVALGGALLALFRRLDDAFCGLAGEVGAADHLFPTFLPAAELQRLDYFRSFPHLVTFPVALDPAEPNLRAFAAGEPLGPDGAVRLTAVAPVRDVLTPAACYHFYVRFRGETLAAPRVVTTRATCFRRETHYAPLERQWAFQMREIVCLGTADEVQEFLARLRGMVDALAARLGVPFAWQTATDPFFDPRRNPKYLAQRLDPVKTEMVFDGRLAIGSVNFHRNYFGEAFGIRRDGAEAFSGCVAFGVERWCAAVLATFGTDPAGWPAWAAP